MLLPSSFDVKTSNTLSHTATAESITKFKLNLKTILVNNSVCLLDEVLFALV